MSEPSECPEEKHAPNPPSWCQLSMFFIPEKYRVVKIVHSNFEVVLQITKHTVIYPGLGPSLEVIALLLAV
jgi:hypothetical protein